MLVISKSLKVKEKMFEKILNETFLKVPTDAVVTKVTTRKNGNPYINGASLNGGTLVWITGKSIKKLFSNFILNCFINLSKIRVC